MEQETGEEHMDAVGLGYEKVCKSNDLIPIIKTKQAYLLLSRIFTRLTIDK